MNQKFDEEKEIQKAFKGPSSQILIINGKKKKSNFIGEKPCRHLLNQVIDITSNGTNGNCVPLGRCNEKMIASLV